MKKLISMALVLVMLVMLFASCDNTPADTTASTSASTTESTASSTTESTSASTTESTSESTTETTETSDTTPVVCSHEFKETSRTPAGYATDEQIIFTCSLCNETKTEIGEKGIYSIKILAVGNSFSVDAMEYLWDVLTGAGFTEVILGNLYIGGCTLDTHADNIKNDSAAYTYYYNDSGFWEANNKHTLKNALTSEAWDIITVQQGSPVSGQPASYSKLQEIVDYLHANKTNKEAKVLWHMTWAYQSNYSSSNFAAYGNNQQTMYDAILSTVKDTVLKVNGISDVIPSGTAVQNLRTSYFGDNVTRDGYHMRYNYARYMLALTWFTKLTGLPVERAGVIPNPYYLDLYTNAPALMEAATAAVANPYEVTTVTATAREMESATRELSEDEKALLQGLGYDPENYLTLELNVTPFAQYMSITNGQIQYNGNATLGNSLQLFHATRIFTKDELPTGTLITIKEGYLYRPNGWTDLNKGTPRPDRITAAVTVVDDAWWGDYIYRGFDFAHADLKTLLTQDETDVLKIFVPKA